MFKFIKKLFGIKTAEHYNKYKGTPKYDYKSMKNAEIAADYMGRKVHKKFEVYNCKECGGWHIRVKKANSLL